MADPFLAQIVMFGGNFAPRGWAFCDGQLLPIAQYSAVFSLLGTTYGGDGRTTFALPDLRGRVPIHPGNGPGLSSYQLGQRGGVENTTLLAQNLPPHNHNPRLRAENRPGNSVSPTGNMLGQSTTNMYRPQIPRDDVTLDTASIVSDTVGNGIPFTNIQPFLCVNYIIALQGVFPSRS